MTNCKISHLKHHRILFGVLTSGIVCCLHSVQLHYVCFICNFSDIHCIYSVNVQKHIVQSCNNRQYRWLNAHSKFKAADVKLSCVKHKPARMKPIMCGISEMGQIFRIGTARYAEGLWRMRRHGPVIAHCTDSEDFPEMVQDRKKVTINR